MRHLNKIIFINSANIPYAEVLLDGNVHFAGTQGVGKSTVLRALLFFYNADKMRIGIQSGQKSFEEFYFSHSNSYIVYEVKTEHSAYSIVVFRSQGKAVYHFIDAPYKKEWFVNDGGRVDSDWISIRNRIGKVDITPKIETYELYRNIIFGNTHDKKHRFDKFALVESSKYQNIPRSIQNVFLNSKLDADFVKNTIIQSMTDNENAIRLSDYRHLVSDFEREFDEIDCWYRKDSNGEIVVRTKAEKVINTYKLLIAIDHEITQTWHQLNYSVNLSREQLPILEDCISNLEDELKKIHEKIENTQQEYEKEHDKLIYKIAQEDGKLAEIRRKQKEYNDIDIKSIIELDTQESKFYNELKQRENILHALQEQYKDVTERYKALRDALNMEIKSFELAQKEEIQRYRDSIQTERENFRIKCDKRKKEIENAYYEWLTKSDERLAELQEECNRKDKKISELQYWHPMKQDTDACNESLSSLKDKEKELRSELVVVNSELKLMRQKAEKELDDIEKDYSKRRDEIQSELQQTRDSLSEVENILSRWKGSLYEWLSDNKPGWEENIGKVVNEQKVLYAQGLSPSLTNDGNMFGVSINLDAIESHHRTPDEYRDLQRKYQEDIITKKKEINDLELEFTKEKETVTKSYNNKLSELQKRETELKVELEYLPQKIKDKKTTLRTLFQKEEEMIANEQEKRKSAYNDARMNLERENTSRKNQKATRDKDMRTVDNKYNSFIKELQKRFDIFKDRQKDEQEKREKEFLNQKRHIEQQERDELRGFGADTNAIDECKKNIDIIQDILSKIAKQRHYVIEYRKDEKELFSKEAEFREEKHRLETHKSQVRQLYDDKRKRYKEKADEKNSLLNENKSRLDLINDGLKQYEQFYKIENMLPESLLQDDRHTNTNDSCANLVVQMRGVLNKKRQKQDELKRVTNAFNSHFSANNTFHFIVPQYDEDYMKFAANLLDFIENDKIEIYRTRVSELYNTILRSVSREVGLLMNYSAEIKSTINEVNKDFQKSNFAGVIRSIELRAEESSDKMMLLLKSIRDFTEENDMNIGELNLFSGDDRDKINDKVVDFLKRFIKQLQKEPSRTELSLSDTFRLQFRIQENDNNTGWVERINNVGSDGTDILVKAMVNIMLINVFKRKAARKNGDFIVHCMMDEIGKLHPNNVRGILQFANVRNIYLINSSPMGYNADIYKYNYLLTKDSKSQTHIKRLVTINE